MLETFIWSVLILLFLLGTMAAVGLLLVIALFSAAHTDDELDNLEN